MKRAIKPGKPGGWAANFLLYQGLNALYIIPGGRAYENRQALWKYPHRFPSPPFCVFLGTRRFALLPGRFIRPSLVSLYRCG